MHVPPYLLPVRCRNLLCLGGKVGGKTTIQVHQKLRFTIKNVAMPNAFLNIVERL